jgi:hypothetical protein
VGEGKADSRQQTVDGRPETADSRVQIADMSAFSERVRALRMVKEKVEIKGTAKMRAEGRGKDRT